MAMRLLKALKRSGFWLRERRNRLWVTPALASVVAVLLALAAAWVSRVVPEDTLPDIDRDTVQSLLTIVASSMLAVTTFSLSIMVSAFASAANGATPRATELVMGDEGTRSAIAMFLSAFIYAVVARVALGMGYYGGAGRFVLFLGTMGVLVMLLVTLVNWVKTLSTLGRMSNTLNKIEQAAEKALRTHWRAPLLGAGPAPAIMPRFDLALRFAPDGLARFLANPPPPGWHDLMALMRQGALRVRGKGGKERLVPLGEVAAEWLLRYVESSRPLLL